MKILGEHLQIVSNECTHFQKNSPIPQNMRGQKHVNRRETDRQIDGQSETNMPPYFVCWGYNE